MFKVNNKYTKITVLIVDFEQVIVGRVAVIIPELFQKNQTRISIVFLQCISSRLGLYKACIHYTGV